MPANTTPAEDNELHGLSPASRNEGPDSHKDNSKHMGKIHTKTTTSDNAKDNGGKDKDKAKDNEDTGDVNETQR